MSEQLHRSRRSRMRGNSVNCPYFVIEAIVAACIAPTRLQPVVSVPDVTVGRVCSGRADSIPLTTGSRITCPRPDSNVVDRHVSSVHSNNPSIDSDESGLHTDEPMNWKVQKSSLHGVTTARKATGRQCGTTWRLLVVDPAIVAGKAAICVVAAHKKISVGPCPATRRAAQ